MITTMRDVAISIGFLILIPLALLYGIGTFMKRPPYPSSPIYDLERKLSTLKKEGIEEDIARIKKELAQIKKELEAEQKELKRDVPAEEIASVEEQLEKAKQVYKQKEIQHKNDMAKYNWNQFLVSIIIGSVIALFGTILAESLGTGFIFGGVACIVIGFMNYWWQFNDITRFSILLCAVLFLLSLGYWRFYQYKKSR